MNDIQAALLQFTVPCGGCKGNGRVEMLEHCSDCQGSGVRFPFRLPCPGDIDDGCPYTHQDNMDGMDTCPPCNGLGYIFNPDPDILWGAVRARGWFVCFFQYYEWDEAVIQNRNGDPIATTTKKEGLRGQAALQRGVWLADGGPR